MGQRRSGTAKHRESEDLNISGMTPTEGDPLSSQNIKTKPSSICLNIEIKIEVVFYLNFC